MVKIGFVYLDGIYLIPHFIGSAAELHKEPGIQVDILTNEMEHEFLFNTLKEYDLPASMVKKLPTYLYKKIAYKIQGRKKPSNQYIIKKNMKVFLDYDILVFTVFNNKRIKRKGRHPKYVFLMHGAGDSNFPFEPEHKEVIEEFCLVTTPGQKVNDLFAKMGDFSQTKFEICGYQKLDFVQKNRKKQDLFDNDNPIVMYNPHFSEKVNSFYKYGMQILDFFYRHPSYNFIFAPHMNLFNTYSRHALPRDMIPEKYMQAKNILVDFGSEKSIDMTYTGSADIYIGDVSSQIYEFLLEKPKPAIFIDVHKIRERKNNFFKHFELGKVVENIDNLKELLETSEVWQQEYEEKQRKAIAYTFDINPQKTSSKRVAEAILELIDTGQKSVK